LTKFGQRLYLNWLTIVTLIRTYPVRLVRFIFHFFQWLPIIRKNHLPSNGFAVWTLDFGFYIADLFIIPDIIEIAMVWVQPNIRLLNEEEKVYSKKYFKNKVNLKNVRVNNRISKWVENIAIAFVTFHTIHYSKTISIPIFIHEMVHVWQYQKFGTVYIFRALLAQKSKEGYNYGGLESLYSKMLSNYIFTDFNFEQQGEIFEDYCRMKESQDDQNPIAEASFEFFVGQVRGSEIT